MLKKRIRKMYPTLENNRRSVMKMIWCKYTFSMYTLNMNNNMTEMTEQLNDNIHLNWYIYCSSRPVNQRNHVDTSQ